MTKRIRAALYKLPCALRDGEIGAASIPTKNQPRTFLHRDLKPRNVLLCPAPAMAGLAAEGEAGSGLQLKVLDFGLAVARGTQSPTGELLGTLLYMAPELFQGDAGGPETDLYAVGVIAYELLVGYHPFAHHKDAASLLSATLTETPDLTPLAKWPTLSALIGSLLSKDPALRPSSADRVLQRILCELDGSTESEEARDSFLVAARFVGRRNELATLCQAVDDALLSRGGAWLIGGESGVGKSRLLDEVRTHALVHGVRVLRGQATQERASGLALFREVIRALALSVPISLAEASVLQRVAADLPVLLDAAIPDAPILDPQLARQKLQEATSAVLLRCTSPLLLILEDLHWIDADTLDLLASLIPQLHSRAILLLCSYRDDERRDLPIKLPGAAVLPLHRLLPQEVAELSLSILGEAAERADLQSLLQRETEGNTFFVIEVMRALAEEAGGLRAVAERTIPQRVVSGGISAVVRRRLRRIPASALMLLQTAAVAGRELDLQVLRAIDPQIDAVLPLCADAAILEVEEDRWRFAHSKLREGVLSELSDAQRITCHRVLATTIERVYPQSEAHAAVLGFHFERAQDLERAVHHLGVAALVSLRRGALHEAKAQLRRTAQLQEQLGATNVERAITLRRLSRALYGLGEGVECAQVMSQAMALVGVPIPTSVRGRRWAIAKEALVEVRNRLRGAPRLFSPEERAQRREQLNLMVATGEALFTSNGSFELVLYVTLCSLHAAEELDDIPYQITYLSSVGYTFSLYLLRPLSHYYMSRARQLAEDSAIELPITGFHSYSGLCAQAEGHWQQAEQSLLIANTLTQRQQELSQEALMQSMLTALYMDRADLPRVSQHAARVEAIGIQLGNRQFEATGRGWRAFAMLPERRYEEAYAMLADASILMEQTSSRPHRTTISGGFALAALLFGDVALAQEMCERALSGMDKGLVPAPSFRLGYSSTLAVCMSLWIRSKATPQEAASKRRVLRALRHMIHLSLVFPIAAPWALLGIGRYLIESGQSRLGRFCQLYAYERAEQLDFPLHKQIGADLLDDALARSHSSNI